MSDTTTINWEAARSAFTRVTSAQYASGLIADLQRIADRDSITIDEFVDLGDTFCHQNSIYPYSIPAIDVLIAIASDPTYRLRAHAAGLALRIGQAYLRARRGEDAGHGADGDGGSHTGDAVATREMVTAARDAVTAHIATFRGWLTDPDLRTIAIQLLGLCGPDPDHELTRFLRAELDRVDMAKEQVAILASIVDLTIDAPPRARIELREWLSELLRHPDDRAVGAVGAPSSHPGGDGCPTDIVVPLAAALILLRYFRAEPTPNVLDVLTKAVSSPTVAKVLGPLTDICHVNFFETASIGNMLCESLGDRRDERITLATAMHQSEDPRVRADACRALYAIAAAWRSPTPRAVALAAQALGDPDQEVREVAARALAALGSLSAAASNQLAHALQDPHRPVRDLALIALAMQGDQRAVPAIRAHLTPTPDARENTRRQKAPRACMPWEYARVDDRFWRGMRPHAAALLPDLLGVMRTRVAAGASIQDLLTAIRVWGLDAADATSTLTAIESHLDFGHERRQLGFVLEAIGAPALTQVRQLATPHPSPGDDGDLALRLSTPVDTWGSNHVLEQAVRDAEALGAQGAPYAALVRALFDHPSPWMRVAAARAYYVITNDHQKVLPILLPLLRNVERYQLAGILALTAIDILGLIGPPAAEIAPVLRDLLSSDHRLGNHGGCLGNLDDIEDDHDRIAVQTALRRITSTTPPDA